MCACNVSWELPVFSCITNCSRGIRNAWHFYYAFVLVIKVICGGIGIALAHPLTRRYV
ncbi:DUF3265 domain-containing protein [Vibrio parahaemolyticus]|nr:DUF3265 domain-containing protein [Vibrio parahaemolyticus]